ncbi:MAG TPA: tetratricopeptide repeat protein [Chitinivibrionales bacterium]|nr:tetratricopeptide repeat protein [Chitinivibrionales bacterium]
MDYEITDFEQDVIEKSKEIPVLADFWAEWCAPCKVLGPILERLAEKNAGKWILVKVNTEAHQDVALRYKIGSIPDVKLFIGGEVVDEFLGALPEELIVKWLKEVIPGKYDAQMKESLDLLKSGQAERAAVLLEQVLEAEPGNSEAKVLLGRALIFSDPDRAESLCREVQPGDEVYETAEMVLQCSALLKKRNDPDALADAPVKALYLDAIDSLSRQDFDSALGKMIRVMEKDRAFEGDGAKKACIAIFHCLGEDHEITKKHRHAFGRVLNV